MHCTPVHSREQFHFELSQSSHVVEATRILVYLLHWGTQWVPRGPDQDSFQLLLSWCTKKPRMAFTKLFCCVCVCVPFTLLVVTRPNPCLSCMTKGRIWVIFFKHRLCTYVCTSSSFFQSEKVRFFSTFSCDCWCRAKLMRKLHVDSKRVSAKTNDHQSEFFDTPERFLFLKANLCKVCQI